MILFVSLLGGSYWYRHNKVIYRRGDLENGDGDDEAASYSEDSAGSLDMDREELKWFSGFRKTLAEKKKTKLDISSNKQVSPMRIKKKYDEPTQFLDATNFAEGRPNLAIEKMLPKPPRQSDKSLQDHHDPNRMCPPPPQHKSRSLFPPRIEMTNSTNSEDMAYMFDPFLNAGGDESQSPVKQRCNPHKDEEKAVKSSMRIVPPPVILKDDDSSLFDLCSDITSGGELVDEGSPVASLNPFSMSRTSPPNRNRPPPAMQFNTTSMDFDQDSYGLSSKPAMSPRSAPQNRVLPVENVDVDLSSMEYEDGNKREINDCETSVDGLSSKPAISPPSGPQGRVIPVETVEVDISSLLFDEDSGSGDEGSRVKSTTLKAQSGHSGTESQLESDDSNKKDGGTILTADFLLGDEYLDENNSASDSGSRSESCKYSEYEAEMQVEDSFQIFSDEDDREFHL